MLVHGFTGSSHDFALEVDALAADRRVVTLDQRGHGHSSKVGSVDGYSIEQLVADCIAFLEAVGDGPVDLLGHSMGGRVVMGVVLSRPDLVRSLVLMDTSAWSFMPPDEEIRTMVRTFMTAFDPAQGMPATLSLGGPEDELIAAAVPPEWQAEKDAIFTGMDAYAVKALGMALMADVADGETSLRADLPSITCPTTVIVGRARPPSGRPGPGAGGGAGRRPAHRDPRARTTRPSSRTRTHWRARRRGAPGVGREARARS